MGGIDTIYLRVTVFKFVSSLENSNIVGSFEIKQLLNFKK